ncbi:hypothetical protein C2E23DRAFT_320157 [Lenzites betulinus]|nr:hypothetical protein C2E23DRAFT_320157 [Lenzites betulinus]
MPLRDRPDIDCQTFRPRGWAALRTVRLHVSTSPDGPVRKVYDIARSAAVQRDAAGSSKHSSNVVRAACILSRQPIAP